MRKLNLLLFAIVIGIVSLSAQMFEPVKWKFSSKNIDDSTVELIFNATIEKGWHLYSMKLPEDGPLPTQFIFESKKGATLEGSVVAKSKLIEEYDKIFEMTLGYYNSSASFSQKIKFNPERGYKVDGYIKFQSCNDEACINGEAPFSFELKGKKTLADEPAAAVTNDGAIAVTDTAQVVVEVGDAVSSSSTGDIFAPALDKLDKYNKEAGSTSATAGRSLVWIFFMGMLGGLIALITPCVWPVIPMTVSFFLKRSGENKAQARKDAILYGLGIVIIYVLLGLLITLIFGPNALNALSTNAIFNVFLFVLLIVFAISFFGVFEITLPASWSSKMDAKASSTTGFISIFFMSFVLVIVSFSCTGPIIGFLLVNVTSGGLWAPMLGMLGFAIALAIPFSFFAFFPSLLKSMPKSGGWLNTVKVVLAFIELAFALKFLSVADLAYGWGILDREVFLVLWIVIFALLGFYLLGKLRFPHDDEEDRVSIPKFFLATISLAFAIYMIPGLWGAPLKAVSAFSPPMNTQDFTMYENHLEAHYSDYELGMAAAKVQKKPVVVDFSGFGCVNCRKMEAAVWTDNKVHDKLKNDFILISLMVDDKTPLPEVIEVEENGTKRKLRTLGDKYSYIQRHRFGANAQPFYVILDENGDPMAGSYAFSESVDDFLKFLDFGMRNYKEKNK
ncbi:thiol:disulfide interchange protein [Porphyromonadaceae bacterium COT-184 OH4590]|nr:thiol:disulfide interchange protein [Porphyromonadaceae bacterium COT-184 OH4590]